MSSENTRCSCCSILSLRVATTDSRGSIHSNNTVRERTIMSDDSDDDDLFGGNDSDDTADLIAASKSMASKKAAPTKKKAAPKKVVASKKGKDDDDDDSDGGLFDSDSDDDDDDNDKKAAAKPKAAPKPNDALSKRQRLEALAHRKKGPEAASGSPKKQTATDQTNSASAKQQSKDSGYDSEDSYESATFERTADDDNFIDTTGEDADAVNELYAEQHFADERPDHDGDRRMMKQSKKRRMRADHDDDDNDRDGVKNADLEPDNPVMAAVHRMKKKKRDKKTLTEAEDEVKAFVHKMEVAAIEDEASVLARQPALKKLSLLNEVCDMLSRKDMQRLLLDFDVLVLVRRWMMPLPNGTLGNVTVRQRLLDAIRTMTGGETGITANDLKRSELGKTVMILYKHRAETPNMKRQWKALVELWSRPIFEKSGNMRDLERVHGARGADGLAALARTHQIAARQQEQQAQRQATLARQQDIGSLIESGKKSGTEAGGNRVRVPFSKGFAFSVRPESRGSAQSGSPAADSGGKRSGGGKDDGTRSKLAKRMSEKGRLAGKNQRSANVSVEGRVSKG